MPTTQRTQWTQLYKKRYGIVTYYASMFYYNPPICYAVNPSLRGQMPAKIRLHHRIWGRLGLLGLTRIARNPIIDFRRSIIAIIDFESQLLGLEQSESIRAIWVENFWPKKSNIGLWKSIFAKTHFEQFESFRDQKPTSSNPSPSSNPSRPRICKQTK